jgi:hypothetical protein
MTADHRNAFVEEAHELLAELDNSLLELQERPDDKEFVGRLFSAMHAIKGAGANLTLAAKNQMRLMLEGPHPGEAPDGRTSGKIVAAFQGLASGTEAPYSTPSKRLRLSDSEGASPPPIQGRETTYRIRFVPSRNIFLSGTNPLLPTDELRTLGESEVIGGQDNFGDTTRAGLCHEDELKRVPESPLKKVFRKGRSSEGFSGNRSTEGKSCLSKTRTGHSHLPSFRSYLLPLGHQRTIR